MSQIYDPVKSLVTPDMITRASNSLGEDRVKVSSAVSTIIPSLLGRALKEGDSNQAREVVEDAGKQNLMTTRSEWFDGCPAMQSKNIDERMKDVLLSSKEDKFVSELADKSGVSKQSAGRLTKWIAGAIAAYFGDKVVREKRSYKSVLDTLDKEKHILKANIPTDIYSTLGLSSVMGNQGEKSTEPKGSMSWIWWVIIILVLIVICIFWWRSCERNRVRDTANTAYYYGDTRSSDNTRVRNNTATMATATDEMERGYRDQAQNRLTDNSDARLAGTADTRRADSINARRSDSINARRGGANANNSNREMVRLTLADGSQITAYEDGCEHQMLMFMQSDDYRNRNSDAIRTTWFEFDNLDFEHDSATQLTSGSRTQLSNLASIMQSHPNARIKIGGFADETGTRAVNMEISEQRANYIKSELERAGISANRISTEGFGKEFATVPAEASNAERAQDRTIALRFM